MMRRSFPNEVLQPHTHNARRFWPFVSNECLCSTPLLPILTSCKGTSLCSYSSYGVFGVHASHSGKDEAGSDVSREFAINDEAEKMKLHNQPQQLPIEAERAIIVTSMPKPRCLMPLISNSFSNKSGRSLALGLLEWYEKK
eukprot:scaffold40110_cov16-Prasinocladus_malaysianus.AAC.1